MDAVEKKYTYTDYCKFNDDKRREIINGVIYLMTAPNKEHQEILVNLSTEFNFYLKGKKCKVYVAPFDIRLPKEGETKATVSTTVQPDIVVICDKNKLDRRGCFGAPDLVIEILSPSTGQRDLIDKFNLYQEHGVREYWIVDAAHQIINRFSLDESKTKYNNAEQFFRDDLIIPVIFPDFTIKLADVFPPLEDEYE
ncbi:MAG: Uma2 family endonuclease [Sporomusaceae bacterium]|jgi:Uma2 family endonuclease|nr:Uma2 family endonuclease [Sporomusaceae bacterium]